MAGQDITADEKQPQKGFFGRMKETWDLLLPIYKDAIKHDPKRFIKSLATNLGIAAIWGGVAPWVNGYALNAVNAAVATKVATWTALSTTALKNLLNASESILGVYQGTTQEAFSYLAQQHRGLKRTKEAANIPESARGQKDPKTLSEYALKNAKLEIALLNDTTNLAFYVPALCFGVTQAFICNPIIGAAVMASVGTTSYLAYRTARKTQKDNEDFIHNDTAFTAQQRDVLDNQTRVKALGREDEEYADLEELSNEAVEAKERRNSQFRKGFTLQAIVRGITEAGLGMWACYYAITEGEIGLMSVLTTAGSVATFSGMRMTKVIGDIRENLGKWYSTKKALSYERSHELSYGDRTPEKVQGHLIVRGSSYTYPGNVRPTLENINLSLGHGLTVITGPSGGGKSTLLALLQHRREGEGEVLLDGVPVTELPRGFLEKQTTVVYQQPSFFAQRTVDKNMDSVRSDVNQDDKRQALKSVGLYKELGQEGISRKLSELSGGQKQRENLAEAVVRQTPIMIYDEPTANLDQINRRRNWKNLLQLSQDHTVIVVSHNAQEIESADRVITVENGRITQDGVPADLANRRGYVKELLKDSKRPLRISPQNEAIQKLNQLKQEALVGLKSKSPKVQKRRLKYVIGPGLAQSLMQATSITDVDEAAIRAQIEAFKAKGARLG